MGFETPAEGLQRYPQGAAHLAGGVAGIYLGRPFARAIVSALLPPRVRQFLAFLWLADGKQPPPVVSAQAM